MTDRSLSDLTRRAVLKATAGALGAGAAGTASAHEKWSSDGGSTTAGRVGDDVPGNTVGADVVGYHSLVSARGAGSPGTECTRGRLQHRTSRQVGEAPVSHSSSITSDVKKRSDKTVQSTATRRIVGGSHRAPAVIL